MRKRILKWRRDRAVDRIMRNGEALKYAGSARWAINESYGGSDGLVHLDSYITRLELQIEKDKQFIRDTAQEA